VARPRPGDLGDLGQIAGYRLTGFLGEGGQGAVYRGLSPSEAEVAVKVLHARLSDDPEARRRFFRQVELARRAAPFCTARVLGTGMHDDRPYIVSEYVPGASLERVVRTDGPRTGGGLSADWRRTGTARRGDRDRAGRDPVGGVRPARRQADRRQRQQGSDGTRLEPRPAVPEGGVIP
jgi:hypothetical protein